MSVTNTQDLLLRLRELKPILAVRYRVKEIGRFGSFVREEQSETSDIDVLVEFELGKTPGFLKLADMERELSTLFGNRKVDLRTPQDLSHHFRDRVIREAEVICR